MMGRFCLPVVWTSNQRFELSGPVAQRSLGFHDSLSSGAHLDGRGRTASFPPKDSERDRRLESSGLSVSLLWRPRPEFGRLDMANPFKTIFLQNVISKVVPLNWVSFGATVVLESVPSSKCSYSLSEVEKECRLE